MISSFAYFLIFGKPLIMYSGILTLISLLLTASIGYTTRKGIKWVPFKYHPFMAKATVTLALIHGIMGISRFFNL